MTRFTDGSKTAEISMAVWLDGQWQPDWEMDFFDIGMLKRVEDEDGTALVYVVDDVDYLIDQAEDWRMGRGDYRDDYEGEPGHNPDDRSVNVTIIDGGSEV